MRSGSRTHSARRERTALLTALLLASTFPSGVARADDEKPRHRVKADSSKVLSYALADSICRQFAGVTPPPPPMGSVVVGTLDRNTGIFTWNPQFSIRPWIPPTWAGSKPGAWISSILAVLQHITPVQIDPTAVVSVPPDPLVVNGAPIGRPTAINTISGVRVPPAVGHVESGPASGSAAPSTQQAGASAHVGGLAFRQVTPGPDSAVFLPVNGGPQMLVFRAANLRPNDVITVQIGNLVTQFHGTASVEAGSGAVEIAVPLTTFTYFTVTITGSLPAARLPNGPRLGSPAVGIVQRFGSYLVFDRPPVIGCFTLEAYPLTILYEPPGNASSQTYTTSSAVGTTIKTFSSSDTSKTAPVNTPFSDVTNVINALGKISQGLTAIAKWVPWAAAAGSSMQTAASALQTIWGSSITTQGVEQQVSDEHSLMIREMSAQSLSTELHLGPGKGDEFYYVTKPVFLWLLFSDPNSGNLYVTVSLLGYEGLNTATAEALRAQNQQNQLPIPRAVQQLLLEDDPAAPEYRNLFPAGEPGRLDSIDVRFTFTGGAPVSYTLSHAISTTDAQTLTVTRNITTTEQSGLLGMLGLPGPHTGTTSITTINGGTTSVTKDSVASVVVQLNETDTLVVHNAIAFYDTKYGTFLYEEIPPSAPSVAGLVTDPSGAPIAGQRVEFLTPRMTFVTWTNGRGRYAFRSGPPPRGSHTLRVGSHRELVAWSGAPVVRNIVLAPGSR